MAATTMQSITSLANKLSADFPSYAFVPAGEFHWDPEERTVFYDESSLDAASLLHEVAHAVLGHAAYRRDIELIELERQAWEYAEKHLSAAYEVALSPAEIEDSLDSYRDWLHARSTCPHCGAAGLQVRDSEYKCLACATRWRVNDARACALRRYKIAKNKN